MLAAKTALGIRVDALGDSEGVTIGFEGREKVELRLKQLEGGATSKASGSAVKAKPQQEKYAKPANASVLSKHVFLRRPPRPSSSRR
jgi:nucleolar protein 58